MWNRALYEEFRRFEVGSSWQLPLVQGFVGKFNTLVQGKELEYILISRRSSYKPGTRYNSRGLDDQGNVANFVETEQIFYYNGYCCSFVQIRGSVPIFFQQRGMTAATKITRQYALTNAQYLEHFDQVTAKYGYCVCVNLLAKGKKEEQMLTEAFEVHINNNKQQHVRYEFFDFHFHTKGSKFEKLNALVLKFQLMLERFKFYAEDIKTQTALISQEGVFRTNCLDCLDRTNVLQSKIAICVFETQLKQLGLDLVAVIGKDPISQIDNDNPKQQHPFLVGFKNIWADNADTINLHYAGTGSTISNVTRTGKQDMFGFIKSIDRFYQGNFEDSARQEAIDILTGQSPDILQVQADTFERVVRLRESEYTNTSDVSIFISTWNMGGYEPEKDFKLNNLFDFEGAAAPDIIVVGFQEFVELNAKNMMSADQSKCQIWIDVIAQNLKSIDKYAFVRYQNLVGILIIIFAKENICQRISKLDSDVVKTGLAGTVGNKGGCIIKFNIDDSSFVFTNVHLEAGGKANKERLANISDIHTRAFQLGSLGKKKVISINFITIVGRKNHDFGL